jgi:hypothetical protein
VTEELRGIWVKAIVTYGDIPKASAGNKKKQQIMST